MREDCELSKGTISFVWKMFPSHSVLLTLSHMTSRFAQPNNRWKTCFPHVNVMSHMTPSRIIGRSLCSQKIPWPLGEDTHSLHDRIGGELRKTPHVISFKTMEGKAVIMFKFMKGACLTFKLGISQCTKDLHTKFILSVLYLLKYIEILTGLPLSSTKENYI